MFFSTFLIQNKTYFILFQLSEELDIISERDERLKQELNRKERLTALLSKNKSYLEASLSNLDEFLNKGNRTGMNTSYNRTLSPNYRSNK